MLIASPPAPNPATPALTEGDRHEVDAGVGEFETNPPRSLPDPINTRRRQRLQVRSVYDDSASGHAIFQHRLYASIHRKVHAEC